MPPCAARFAAVRVAQMNPHANAGDGPSAAHRGLRIPCPLKPLKLPSRQVDACRDDLAPFVLAPESQRRLLLLCRRRRVLIRDTAQERRAARVNVSVLVKEIPWQIG